MDFMDGRGAQVVRKLFVRAGLSASMGSLGEWLRIKSPKRWGLLFGVASAFTLLRQEHPSDHELLFVIMYMIYQTT